MKLELPHVFAEEWFTAASRPDPRTVRVWIEEGHLPGRAYGALHFVDLDAFGEEPGSLFERVEVFARTCFTRRSQPVVKTIRGWIDSGELPGRKIKNYYYVNVGSVLKQSGNPLADRLLRAFATT